MMVGRSTRLFLIYSVCLGAFSAASMPLHAQTSPAPGAAIATTGAADAGASEQILVTGSSLRTTNSTSPNPVTIVTAKDIQKTTAVTISDYLSRLPSIGSSSVGNTSTNGGDGLSCADIRNLGSARTLILIDGKREVQTGGFGFSCVDINSIPVSMVDSVEILKDGGSALYGADAGAGVINIKLKHNYAGTNFYVKGGLTDAGDARSGLISGVHGFDFDHGRGNVTLGGQYMTQGPVYQADRSWAGPVQASNPASGTPLYGSGVPEASRFFVGSQDLFAKNGTVSNFTDADRYDYSKDQQLTNYVQTGSFNGNAHYTINDHFNLYTRALYTHKSTAEQLAPSPATGSSYPSTLPTSFVFPAGNPYNPFGQDADIYRRFVEFGNRGYSQGTDTYQINGGMNGTIVGDWSYDVSGAYGKSTSTINTSGSTNYRKLEQELGARQVDPSDPNSAVVYDPSYCTNSPGCVLVNPLGKWPTNAVDYARFTQHDRSAYQLRDFNLRVKNDDLVRLPWRGGGDVGISFGAEHRGESGSYQVDPIVGSGDSGGGVASDPTTGAFNATEAFIEGNFPLLHDMPFARDLSVDLQGRFSHYNTFGNTKNWKASINWAPVRDIRFRGTMSTGFRQPNVNELFGAQNVSYNSANDPCIQSGTYGTKSAAVIGRCVSQGINPATFQAANSGQVPTTAGGNPSLQPETSRTYTFGTVLTPRWTPHLTASIDYWHTSIENLISSVSSQYILDQCYTGADPTYCNAISRNGLDQLSSVKSLAANLGGLRTNGIDFNLDYMVRLGRHDTLTLSNQYQQLIGYVMQNVAGWAWNNYAGRLVYTNGGNYPYAIPRVRDYVSGTWTHGHFSATYMMRYIGGMVLNNGSSDLVKGQNGKYQVAGVYYHDVALGYTIGRWNLQANVNNLFDKNAPFVPDAGFNTGAGIYDVVGRTIFMAAGVTF